MEYKLTIEFDGDTGEDAYNRKYVRMINKTLNNASEHSSILFTFVNYLISQDRSYCTAYQYARIIERFMKNVGKTADELQYDDFSNYLAMHKEKEASFKRTLHACLAVYSELLYETKRIEWNYMSSIKAPKFKESRETKKKREESFLTVTELKDIIACAERGIRKSKRIIRERDIAILKLLIITGMRRSALYKLNVDDVDLENKRLYTVEKRSDEQDYYFDDDVRNALIAWLEKREKLMKEHPEEKALFVSVVNKMRLDQESIAGVVAKYAYEATGRKISPHKIRASFATTLYDVKKDIYYVQEAMHHSSPEITKRYIRGKEKDIIRQESANLMGNLMNWQKE